MFYFFFRGWSIKQILSYFRRLSSFFKICFPNPIYYCAFLHLVCVPHDFVYTLINGFIYIPILFIAQDTLWNHRCQCFPRWAPRAEVRSHESTRRSSDIGRRENDNFRRVCFALCFIVFSLLCLTYVLARWGWLSLFFRPVKTIT